MITADVAGGNSEVVAAIVAALTALAAWLTWLRSRSAESRGEQTADRAAIGEEWRLLTAGMREEITSSRKRIESLEASDKSKGREITRLSVRSAEQDDQIAALHAENVGQARQISRLEKALAAARTYITQLIALLRAHNIEPPGPPADYIDE